MGPCELSLEDAVVSLEQPEESALETDVRLHRYRRARGAALRGPDARVALVDRGHESTPPHDARDGMDRVAHEALHDEGPGSPGGSSDVGGSIRPKRRPPRHVRLDHDRVGQPGHRSVEVLEA